MARRYATIHEWLNECRRTVQKDLDNIILFSGEEGSGKSTIMYQIMKALDPTFGVYRIGFTIEDYINNAKRLEKGQAVSCDELLAHRRKSMHGSTLELLEFLQVCRGLNLHHALCFPHETMLDRAIMDFRVRHWLHVPKRGVLHIKEKFTYFLPGGEETKGWRIAAIFHFRENKGPEWEAYLEAKAAHMHKRNEADSEEDKLPWNPEYLRTLPQRYIDARGPLKIPAETL
jgi:ABC-type dipeptide/oligopeptide/nickel transport system ATPase component